MGSYPPRVVLALRTPSWCFHTAGAGDYRFRPRFGGVVYMEIFLIWRWDIIFPGWRWLYEPQIGVSTPCSTVSTRETTVFVPGLVEL